MKQEIIKLKKQIITVEKQKKEHWNSRNIEHWVKELRRKEFDKKIEQIKDAIKTFEIYIDEDNYNLMID